MNWWTATPDGVRVAVKVQPRTRRPGVRGPAPGSDGPRLAIAVAAPPADGAANRAACITLAEALGVPRSSVQVASGAASREKLLSVAGDPAILVARLAAL